ARLVGANRRYLESEIPHIASLLCSSVDELVAHADLLILSAASEHSAQAARLARAGQVIVDLTRGALPGLEDTRVGVEEWVGGCVRARAPRRGWVCPFFLRPPRGGLRRPLRSNGPIRQKQLAVENQSSRDQPSTPPIRSSRTEPSRCRRMATSRRLW